MTRWLWLLPVSFVLVLVLVLVGVVWLRGFRDARELRPGVASEVTLSSTAAAPEPGAPEEIRVSVVARYPHDTDAFTQGLLWHQGSLYETTGHYGRSRLRRVDLESGEVEQEIRLESSLFGEGLAPTETAGPDELIWLTWKAGRALRFDLEDFSRLGEFAYDGEGWGLTLCDGGLYRSDGTSTLWRHDPENFALLGRFEVARDGDAIQFLNELECTPNGILANVWTQDEIVRIDPRSGRVTATIDASGLLAASERVAEGVLNGIAYRTETDTLLITGKYWPWIFEVVLEAESGGG